MFEEIRDIICKQLNIDESFVYPDTNLMKSLDVNSLNLREIILAIEDKYQVEIPDDEIDNMNTVGDIIAYLSKEA